MSTAGGDDDRIMSSNFRRCEMEFVRPCAGFQRLTGERQLFSCTLLMGPCRQRIGGLEEGDRMKDRMSTAGHRVCDL